MKRDYWAVFDGIESEGRAAEAEARKRAEWFVIKWEKSRRRVKVIGRLPGEQSCLSLVRAVLDRVSKGWRGLTMTPKILRQLQDLRRELLDELPPLPHPDKPVNESVTAAA